MTAKPSLPALLRGAPLRFVCGWSGETAGYFPMHSHPVMELVHHPRGSGVTALGDGRRIDFEPHGTVIYPPRVRHDQRMRTRGVDICIHAALPAGLALPAFSEALYVPPSDPRGADPFIRAEFSGLAGLRPGAERQAELDLRVTALVLRLMQLDPSAAREDAAAPAETYLARARRFIAEHYARISGVGEIARHVGVSEDYLRHLFAREGGTSLNRLLGQTRIERAKELLIHTPLPIKEIASLSGFKTERYLSTRFRQATRLSPGAYRRRAAEGGIPSRASDSAAE